MSLGLVLMAIGYGGTFFGNMIKAAVSRQREFLADASAVQFTRNPLGISGALKKIGGFHRGSAMSSSHAAEFSHMFFGQGIKTAFGSLMSTHPPLKDRVKRIEPRWQGTFPTVADTPVQENTPSTAGASQFASSAAAVPSQMPVEVFEFAEPASIARADALIAGIPKALYQASHEAFSARAMMYGLLLDNDKTIRDRQLLHLSQRAHPATVHELSNSLKQILRLDEAHSLTLINLAIPALKQQSQPQYEVFKTNLSALIREDQKVSLFEWCMYRILVKNIEAQNSTEKYSLKQLKKQAIYLVLITAAAGKSSDPKTAIDLGLTTLGWSFKPTPYSAGLSLDKLDKALDALEQLKPLHKPKLLKALASTIKADGKETMEEKVLFRAVADTLNCPVPPL